MNSNCSVAKALTLTLLVVVPFLAGCSSAQERRDAAVDMFKDLEQTASGAVNDMQGQVDSLMNMGKSVTDGVTDMVEDAQKRINQVQSGVNMMLQGKDLIEAGVSGEEE